jgi:thiol-disulfide isomerase/thioredoxin
MLPYSHVDECVVLSVCNCVFCPLTYFFQNRQYHGAVREYFEAAKNTAVGPKVKVPRYFSETLGAVELIYSCYAADQSAFGEAKDTVLRALAGNLEYLKPKIVEENEDEEKKRSKLFVPGLQFLDGANIITHSEGQTLTLDDLRTFDIVGIYFSAHWCPPCRKFTPKLAQLYKDITASGKKFGIIFVSGDKDNETFLRYFRQMPWVALDYKERDLQNMLGEAFRVESIPTLVLVDPKTGKFTTKGEKIAALGAAAFPWPLG